MAYATKHTAAGLELMASAQAAGTAINLPTMAVGDGNGNPVTITGAETALYREVYRAAVNRVYKPDPTGDPARFAAELVVPATEGGFVLREVGIFDGDGTLFAIGNLPETYKPQASEGAFADTVVRIEFLATNADVVTLQVDPAVATASQQWVTNNITAGTLLPGGTTGQVLAKASNADGDTVWQDPTDANVIVQTVEETQTLADGQTTVTLSVVNTVGLAVYIEGVRIPKDATADGWQPDGADPTVLTLGKPYPAGTQLFAVQNEPASGFPNALLRDQNLADLENAATARDNLGVPSVADLQNAVPAGAVVHFARSTPPTGWLKANGAEASRTAYADLFNAIGTTYGAGNGVDTFNLPDLRGEFLRGWDDGRGIDAGRTFGSAQADQMQRITGRFAHKHGWKFGFIGEGAFSPGEQAPRNGVDTAGGPSYYTNFDSGDSPGARVGDETRGRNVALLACVKY